MGLDTTHGCWHGSYGTFNRWRCAVALAAGWELDPTHDTYAIPEGRLPDQAPADGYANSVFLGVWYTDPVDVLDVLLLHSDCEGVIPHRFCRPLAERLEGMMEALVAPDEAEDDDAVDWWDEVTLDFCTGLLRADIRGEDVGFH